jgi:hypothetical protein
VAALRALQQEVTTAAMRVAADIQANACKVLNAGCFAAGTKLWTPLGYRHVEEIQPGEYVYARAEHDSYGPIAAKVVEAKFERTGRILHLHLPGGKLIRTTPDHPFFVCNHGWTAAGALQPGDHIRTDGGWVSIAEVYDTGEYEPVYNLRVAEYHTYFVGAEGWGFAAWAHNTYINVAFGTFPGLRTFAAQHNAKIWEQWTPGDFGIPDSQPWNPTDTTGGTGSLFASAVRTAIQRSRLIYFKVTGFNLVEWYGRYLQAGPTFPIGSRTAWEAYQLVFQPDYAYRHPAMRFVAGTETMAYDQFRSYTIHVLESAARQEKERNPDWQTQLTSTQAIRSLIGLFDYTVEMVAAL